MKMFRFLKNELYIIFISVGFYTRIRIPRSIPYEDTMLNKATRYLPFIGFIVGGISALSLFLFYQILPLGPSIVASMIISLLLTGAFHEDGLADTADGLGGGLNVEKKLEIMKDSRVGVYGVAATVLSLIFKFTLLLSIPVPEIYTYYILVHIISRFTPVIIIRILSYVRKDLSSKVKPVSKGVSLWSVGFSFILCTAAIYFSGEWWNALILAGSIVTGLLAAIYFNKQVGGYTGDLLGASQQISELLSYILVIIICTFIV
ncbi:MAG: adenosylcobinamide-GDP ribazoletransferase [Bacteroidetes bacterium]|nr:adenosylcobinamide-GDP ribazoletransferase [Bacteroidota bacterium]